MMTDLLEMLNSTEPLLDNFIRRRAHVQSFVLQLAIVHSSRGEVIRELLIAHRSVGGSFSQPVSQSVSQSTSRYSTQQLNIVFTPSLYISLLEQWNTHLHHLPPRCNFSHSRIMMIMWSKIRKRESPPLHNWHEQYCKVSWVRLWHHHDHLNDGGRRRIMLLNRLFMKNGTIRGTLAIPIRFHANYFP